MREWSVEYRRRPAGAAVLVQDLDGRTARGMFDELIGGFLAGFYPGAYVRLFQGPRLVDTWRWRAGVEGPYVYAL